VRLLQGEHRMFLFREDGCASSPGLPLMTALTPALEAQALRAGSWIRSGLCHGSRHTV
jgi:hypothetical protein